jgi:ribosome biogenesis GTPase
VSLEDYGWTDFFARQLPGELEPGRVILVHGKSYRLVGRNGESDASLVGRLKHEATLASELPAIGDWVGFRDNRIEKVLPRRTRLSRKVPGQRVQEQVVAANIDTVVIVMGLDGDFNSRRLERYLTTVWASGAVPIILLNKADIAESLESHGAEVDAIAMGADVVVTSCLDGRGMDAVRERLRPRQTAVLVGSSGVGKSTLINRLLDEDVQRTREVRASDDRGQHTTTHRELFVLPGGALLIDNPGIRELQLWADEAALEHAFDDVAQLSEKCRYRDCAHAEEPECAVISAVETGELSAERLDSFRNLQKEVRYLNLRQDGSSQRVQKQKWRAIHKQMRKSGKHRDT